MSELLGLLLLIFIGMFAGFLNVTAGGGSLLTLPFLIFLGLSPTTANGTNRIAILVQNIFATTRFHQFNVIPREVTLITAISALIGCVVGANMAIQIDEQLFKRILAVIMVLVLGLMFFRKSNISQIETLNLTLFKKVYLAGAFFFLGIYGGFIQAGIGFLIIIVLSLAGYDLVKTNALKVLVVLIFTPVALYIFIKEGHVDFFKGGVLAIGNALGALIGTQVMIVKGHRFIRWIVMVAVVAFAVKLLIS